MINCNVDLDIVKTMTHMCDGGAHIKKIIVAQRKRVWLITRRTVDRNNPMILVCGRSAMQNRIVDKIQLDADLNYCLLGATYFH